MILDPILSFRLFCIKELSEMAQNISKKSLENYQNRKNNPFLCFDNDVLNYYMGLGRSIDSQLGTRLQHIAFYLTRSKFHCSPNIITLSRTNSGINMKALWFRIDDKKATFNQKIFWSYNNPSCLIKQKLHDSIMLEKTYDFIVPQETVTNIEVEFNIRDKNGNGIPIDLLYFVEGKTNLGTPFMNAYTYEIKSGGNLDTKNALSNANEVKSLNTIFSFCNKSISRFATCYGNGTNKIAGSIGNYLPQEQILIGQEFWNEILPEYISYDEFISIFQEAFKYAKVEEIILEK
ncbi:MAG: hypothetical protein PUE12_08410 [Oscillospiraceae bacterium]|nr:hypothetical protein [Oscillospiraceae bacterium]